MTSPDNAPKIDRAALDRIIRRATELQAGDRDIGESLTPDEVVALGKDVGIPTRYLQQAMLEHQTAASTTLDGSLAGRLAGPAEVRAQRVVLGNADDVLQALMRWMDRNELMVPQRQQSGWASWEPLRGMQAAIRRGTAALDTSKPKFMLSRAETVVATVTQLESGYCHVSMTATLLESRRSHLIGAGVSTVVGLGAGGALATFGLSLVAAVPVGVSLLITGLVLRSYRPIAARVQLGLERALDFLEQGGAKAGEIGDRQPGLLDVVANEIRRAITSGADRSNRSRERPSTRNETKS